MKVQYKNKFLKELSKIPSKTRKDIEHFVFTEVPNSKSIFETGKIEKMKGYPFHYKTRFGAYRLGIRVVDDKLIFERVLHRKDIYRYFP
ncbi:MAG: type II toxin-antitoxin system RelE/ParE family toxin [Syntrophales bacterium]|nr:type II toxin-antitoxin system RelE/ParE family toxin [Syntrophales bacterium]